MYFAYNPFEENKVGLYIVTKDGIYVSSNPYEDSTYNIYEEFKDEIMKNSQFDINTINKDDYKE